MLVEKHWKLEVVVKNTCISKDFFASCFER